MIKLGNKTKIIAIEGPDRVGKQTQSLEVVYKLEQAGFSVALIEIPYDDSFTHKMIYKIVKTKYVNYFKSAFQAIHILNKLICQLDAIRVFKKFDYDFIILDRWKMSTEVYGRASGDLELIHKISNKLLLNPDMTVILLGETYKKNDLDEYEKNSVLQERVKAEYLIKADECNRGIDETNGVVEVVNVSGLEVKKITKKIMKLIYDKFLL